MMISTFSPLFWMHAVVLAAPQQKKRAAPATDNSTSFPIQVSLVLGPALRHPVSLCGILQNLADSLI